MGTLTVKADNPLRIHSVSSVKRKNCKLQRPLLGGIASVVDNTYCQN